MNTLFHPTANCQITICLTQGVHPIYLSSLAPSIVSISHLSSMHYTRGTVAGHFPRSTTLSLEAVFPRRPGLHVFASLPHINPGKFSVFRHLACRLLKINGLLGNPVSSALKEDNLPQTH